MKNIKLILEYDGSNYIGWQRLKDKKNTLQGRLEFILEQITHETIEINGAGRTDKDVHALGQVANFITKSKLSCTEWFDALNELLPKDIGILSVEQMPERFHARYNAKLKEYEYHIWNGPQKSVFERNYSYHIATPLNIELMETAKKYFLGTHDFKNFTAGKYKDKSTVRTIEKIDITKEGNRILLNFLGDGFLHKMVRIIVGTLIEVGLKEKKVSEVEEMFHQESRETSGFTAPAHGLFLKKIHY